MTRTGDGAGQQAAQEIEERKQGTENTDVALAGRAHDATKTERKTAVDPAARAEEAETQIQRGQGANETQTLVGQEDKKFQERETRRADKKAKRNEENAEKPEGEEWETVEAEPQHGPQTRVKAPDAPNVARSNQAGSGSVLVDVDVPKKVKLATSAPKVDAASHGSGFHGGHSGQRRPASRRMRPLWCLAVVTTLALIASGVALFMLHSRSATQGAPRNNVIYYLERNESSVPNSAAPVISPEQIVRVGVCEDKLVDEEARAVLKELTILFNNRGKHVVQVLTDNGVVPADEETPDIIICLGYFYPKSLSNARADLVESAPEIPKKFQGRLVNDVFYPLNHKAITHSKGRPFLVAFSGEPWDRGDCRFDLMFVTRDDYPFQGCATAYFPVLSTTMSKRTKHNLDGLVVDQLQLDEHVTDAMANNRSFMAYVVTQCYKHEYSGLDPLIRSAFFDYVTANYKEVQGYGGCRHTGTYQLENFNEQGAKFDAVTGLFEKFKFVIAFENERHPGYISEKIANALLARTIPVYWGSTNADELLNPHRFVSCHLNTAALQTSDLAKEWDRINAMARPGLANVYIKKVVAFLGTNFSECLDVIKRLDTNDTAYLEVLRQPALRGNRIEGTIFDRRLQAHQIIEALRMQQSYLVAD